MFHQDLKTEMLKDVIATSPAESLAIEFTSIITAQPLVSVDMLSLVANNSAQLTWAAFFTLMMGISL